MIDKAICATRSAWYTAYEPTRLRWERKLSRRRRDDWQGLFVDSTFPLVSVILPTHNRVDLLINRALPSIRAQTYKNLEIIVACHGCTDGTRNVIEGYDPRLVVIDVPRKLRYSDTPENNWFAGPVDPLNAALKIAKGDWIARIDDDDVWTEDHVEALLKAARIGSHEFVSSACQLNHRIVKPYYVDRAPQPDSPECRGVLIGSCQTWLYRSYLRFMRYNPDCWRKTWNKVNDTDLQDRMVAAGVRMGYLDHVTAIVRPRPGETEVGYNAVRQSKEAAA